jgi:hypothetical protein
VSSEIWKLSQEKARRGGGPLAAHNTNSTVDQRQRCLAHLFREKALATQPKPGNPLGQNSSISVCKSAQCLHRLRARYLHCPAPYTHQTGNSLKALSVAFRQSCVVAMQVELLAHSAAYEKPEADTTRQSALASSIRSTHVVICLSRVISLQVA